MRKATWARLQAYKIIHQVNTRQAFARPLIEEHIYTANAAPAERDFAVLLVLGTIAAIGELDLIIEHSLGKRRIATAVMDILRLATYELVFLHKAAYAAVDQAVALAHQLHPRAAGFVNWAMRQIQTATIDFPWGDSSSDITALAHETAFPLWLAKRLVEEQGWEEACEFMSVANQAAPIYAKDLATLKTMRISSHELQTMQNRINAGQLIIADAATQEIANLVSQQVANLAAQKIADQTYQQTSDLTGQQTNSITATQEITNQIRQQIANLATKQTSNLASQQTYSNTTNCVFLEVGSGRGTKTVLINHQLQQCGHNLYQHWAIDKHEFKTNLLQERIGQYALEDVRARTADVFALPGLIAEGMLPAQFDIVFIDAPCSGSGTLRRHPEIRWRITAADISALAEQGLAFLAAVAPFISPGGSLIYATCSVFAEENEHVVQAFLASPFGAEFTLQSFAADSVFSPYFQSKQVTGGGDAHFAALLTRRGKTT